MIGKGAQSLDVARAASAWSLDATLVFQTRSAAQNNPEAREVLAVAEKPSGRVALNDTPWPRRLLEEVVSSADVGLAWYAPEGKNIELIGLSSGKLAQYLKCGLPVIVNEPLAWLVSRYNFGICVHSPREIERALQTVLANRAEFSRNALRCFDEQFALDRYFPTLWHMLFPDGRNGPRQPQ